MLESKIVADGPVPKNALRKEMIPLHLVMSGVDVVNPVVTHAFINIRYV